MTLSSLERLKLESYLSNKWAQRDDRIRAQALLPKLPTEGTLETWGRLFSCAAEIGIKDSLIILHYALQNGLVHKQCTEGPLIQRDAILDWLNLDNNLPAIWRCYCSSYQGEPAQFPQGEPDKPEQGAAPALSDKEIKALRENGLSVDVIHKQYGIPRDRIKRVNRRYRISPLPRGPKPKTSD